jgi:hypothetical protein
LASTKGTLKSVELDLEACVDSSEIALKDDVSARE